MRIAVNAHGRKIQCRFSNSGNCADAKLCWCFSIVVSCTLVTILAQDVDMELINWFMGYTDIYNNINNSNLTKISNYLQHTLHLICQYFKVWKCLFCSLKVRTDLCTVSIVSVLTWNTVTMAHSKESKFFLSGMVSPFSIFWLNLHPNRCIPRMLYWQSNKNKMHKHLST